jgi:hypothetical protein
MVAQRSDRVAISNSAPFWELLRKRGGLSGPDAIAAAEWTMRALIQSLRTKQITSNDRKKKS